MKVRWKRKNPIFFEKDGSFNPFFLLITMLCCVACWLIVQVFRTCADDVVKVVCIALLAVTINIFVMAAVTQAKAKIIADAHSTGDIARGIVGAVRPFGGKADDGDVDELVPK